MKSKKLKHRSLTNILQEEAGQGLTEYLLLLFLVSVICITAVQKLGTTVKSNLEQAENHINGALTLTENKKNKGGFSVGGINIGDIFKK